ncbi:SGNH hydrolase domain-containing protein [Actinacidiphila sp. bgisy160]|uniref:SGNH hydrolase domain-containing protein n=1 Tax=Actinacidiphila sp. bgisy160 TaxID=3413796 RepID=UPI003D72B2DC
MAEPSCPVSAVPSAPPAGQLRGEHLDRGDDGRHGQEFVAEGLDALRTAGRTLPCRTSAGRAGTVAAAGAWPSVSPLRLSRCTQRLPEATKDPVRRTAVRQAARAGGVTVIDPEPWLCAPDGTCRVAVGNVFVYRDDSHIADAYAEALAPVLAPRLTPLLSHSGRQARHYFNSRHHTAAARFLSGIVDPCRHHPAIRILLARAYYHLLGRALERLGRDSEAAAHLAARRRDDSLGPHRRPIQAAHRPTAIRSARNRLPG